eukprot:525438-Pelagomonas_calceolata.AAC.1
MEALIAAGGRGRRGAAYRRQPFLSGHGGVPWDQKPARKQNGWGLLRFLGGHGGDLGPRLPGGLKTCKESESGVNCLGSWRCATCSPSSAVVAVTSASGARELHTCRCPKMPKTCELNSREEFAAPSYLLEAKVEVMSKPFVERGPECSVKF